MESAAWNRSVVADRADGRGAGLGVRATERHANKSGLWTVDALILGKWHWGGEVVFIADLEWIR